VSERMTSICLPGFSGLAEYGRHSTAEMIEEIRCYAKREKEKMDAILVAKDEDFHVRTYIGVHVHQNIEVLQEGKTK
jgi:hypothetical protein